MPSRSSPPSRTTTSSGGCEPAREVAPGTDHARVLTDLLAQSGVRGNLVNDAHLAALAIEHRCGIVSYDHDFTRFAGVTWSRPTPLT